ncbi:MAG: cytochrome c biogenesis protein ResB [Clostridia bacterium]|nr:cytochrome c biogenesis protein ResB [Clostridia bacterium]
MVQFVCVIFYKPSFSFYRIGFYFVHLGLPLMLIGFALGTILGQSHYSRVPVDPSGNYYTGISDESGEVTDLGFGLKADSFTVEKYDSGSDKQYKLTLSIYEPNNRTNIYYNSGKSVLEVNKTFRKNGWKLYLMEYTDGERAHDGSYLLPYTVDPDGRVIAQEPICDFVDDNGGTSALSVIYADERFSSAELSYLIFDSSQSAYVNAGSSPYSLYSLSGRTRIRIYSGEKEGDYLVYASGTSVLILFKRDPGEYFVLAGMAFSALGIIMMCLIGNKSKKRDGDDFIPDRQVSAYSPSGKGGGRK